MILVKGQRKPPMDWKILKKKNYYLLNTPYVLNKFIQIDVFRVYDIIVHIWALSLEAINLTFDYPHSHDIWYHHNEIDDKKFVNSFYTLKHTNKKSLLHSDEALSDLNFSFYQVTNVSSVPSLYHWTHICQPDIRHFFSILELFTLVSVLLFFFYQASCIWANMSNSHWK